MDTLEEFYNDARMLVEAILTVHPNPVNQMAQREVARDLWVYMNENRLGKPIIIQEIVGS